MQSETLVITREALYREVWAEPMGRVAERYGLSDTALVKICRRLAIPRPSRSHRALKALGRPVTPGPLPPLPPGADTEYEVKPPARRTASPEVGEEARQLLLREQDPAMAVSVTAALEKPHRWIRESAKALRSYEKNGPRIFHEHACLDIRASCPVLDRALRIADTLLKALESRGSRIEVTEPIAPADPWQRTTPSKTGVHILASFVEFGIEECMDAVKIDPVTLPYCR